MSHLTALSRRINNWGRSQVRSSNFGVYGVESSGLGLESTIGDRISGIVWVDATGPQSLYVQGLQFRRFRVGF